MGRSVSYPSNAIVAFTHLEADEDDTEGWAFVDFSQDYAEQLGCLFPTVEGPNRETWLGRENRVIASNRHAHFGISEYCGLVATWVVVREDAEQPGLAERWVASIAPRFLKTFGTLHKIGTASNGEAFFQQVVA